MRARGWLAAAGLVLGLTSCSAEPYACRAHSQCVRAEQPGTCVAGSCAYEDEGCRSGLRFSPNAGDRAGLCVEDDEPGTSTGGSSGTEGSGESGVIPGCGNEVLEPDEECDDGNQLDGDGCSATCLRAGGLRWLEVIEGPAGLDDALVGLVPRAEGGVVLAAELGETEPPIAVHLRALAADGSTVAEWTSEPAERRAHALGTIDGRLAVVGDEPSTGAAGTRAWAIVLSPALDEPAPFAVDTLGEDTGRGAMATARGLALVGTQDGLAAARFVEQGGPDWRGDPVDEVHAVAGRSDGAFVVAGTLFGGGTRWYLVSGLGLLLARGDSELDVITAAGIDGLGRPMLAGSLGGSPIAIAYELDGSIAYEWPATDSVLSLDVIAPAPGGDVLLAGNGDDLRSLTRLGPAAQLRWSSDVLGEQAGARVLGVVHHADAIVVAGTLPSDEGDLDVFVAALQP